ncbi:lysine--tRNA ligase [Candidatus Woesearchaeota archaeon]|nr:MAG: lysine--tRNA ligase [Candidatus Woesearchaeota archaeon]
MTEEALIKERLKKLEAIRKLGINPYPYKFPVNGKAAELKKEYERLKEGEKSEEIYSVAGRVMSLRIMGGASFGHIEDFSGRIQFYIKKDEGKKQYKLLGLLDIGDIIGVEGPIFKTKTGEVTIWTKKLTLLAKGLRPLPEKWHGLKDPEIRYRQRYLDLIMNRDVKERFVKRTQIINAVREFLNLQGFHEVETPILQTAYGGAAAEPFITHLNALDMDLFLSISPELYLKRLLIGGYEKVYTICKNFRNEGIDRTHNPEFTMMECYQAYADYEDMMKLTEEMIEYVVKKINDGKTKVRYGDYNLDFKTPWKRMHMATAIKKLTKVDVNKLNDNELKDTAAEMGVQFERNASRDEIVDEIFQQKVQEHLIQPTFITDYPKSICPLTKAHRKNPALAERFEGFVCGMELANAYSELNDPIEQRKRFEEQEKKRKKGKKEVYPADYDFITALEYGMPPTGGLGIGIDRLVMVLTNAPSIREVIFFPLLKPKK